MTLGKRSKNSPLLESKRSVLDMLAVEHSFRQSMGCHREGTAGALKVPCRLYLSLSASNIFLASMKRSHEQHELIIRVTAEFDSL